jgi:hypothetical protein
VIVNITPAPEFGVVIEQPSIVHVEIQPQQTIGVQLTAQQGPPGPSGQNGTGEAFTHTQASAASEWTINHNFGYRPSVTLYSVGGSEIDAEVIHISNNQARAYFATNVAGSARCI